MQLILLLIYLTGNGMILQTLNLDIATLESGEGKNPFGKRYYPN